MKKQHNFSIRVFLALIVGLFAASLPAQDDLYYDPATDRPTVIVEETYPADQPDNVTRRYREADENYSDDDDYAYEYSSRIRRFHQPVRVVEYYDPFFSDLWMYDSYYQPGASIYTYGYNDYWSWRRWNRWNRRNYNAWGWGNSFYSPGYTSFGWGNPGYNSWGWNNGWNTAFVTNNYYYDPYWSANGWNPYCPNVVNNYYGNGWNNWGGNWNNNNGNNNNNNGGYTPKTYTGTRRHGSSVNSGFARIADDGGRGRLSPDTKGTPVIEKSTRGRIATDREPIIERKSTGANTTPATGRRPTTTPVADPERTTTGRRPTTAPNSEPERNAGSGRTRTPETERTVEPVRPSRATETPAARRPAENRPAETPATRENRTTRPNGGEPSGDRSIRETRRPEEPRRAEEQRSREVRPSRPSTEESRPSRPSGNEERSRPSAEPRPSRPSGGGGGSEERSRPSRNESRPSNSGGNSSGFSPSPSRSNDSGSSGRSSSGNSNSGRSATPSSGGSRGRQ